MLSPTIRRGGWRYALALLLVVVAGLTGCSSTPAGVDVSTIPDYTRIPGDPMGPASQSVRQTDGSTWRFDHPATGSITLLYFGYTSCPDVCPTTMADLASAMTKLPDSVRSKVWVEFISTDPHRDTDTQIRAWLDGFDPSFHGGRAAIDEVIAAGLVYGVGIEAPVVVDGDYQVTHGGMLLVLDPVGRAVGFFQQLAGPSSYVTGIPLLVQKYT